MKSYLLFTALLFSTAIFAAQSEVAITVDDLPVHMDLPAGTTRLDVANQMLSTLNKHHIKGVYGFINAGAIDKNEANYSVLKAWVNSGQLLGNHTYNHIDLDKNNSSAFIQQVNMNEPFLISLMKNKNYHYFRYPYLHEGDTLTKRNTVRDYLFSKGYKIAQVTMDFEDYAWNDPYARCVKKGDKNAIKWLKKSYIEHAINAITVSHELSMLIFQRDIKNILLLHIGAFDALMLDDLLNTYEQRGIRFIALDKALSDDIYNVNPDVAQENTDTFLTQMRLAKNIPLPDSITKLISSIPEEKLNQICR